MDILFERWKLWRVQSGKLATMISPIPIKEFEVLVKNLPKKASPGTDNLTWWSLSNISGGNNTNFTQTLPANRWRLLLTECLCPCKIHVLKS